MHVGKKNPRHSYYTSSNKLKSVEVEKDLGIIIIIIFYSPRRQKQYTKYKRVNNYKTKPKTVAIMITSDLKCWQQCEYAYSKANRVMGMIRRTITYKEPKIMLSLYKTLVRPHVEYCCCAWYPSYKKDKE